MIAGSSAGNSAGPVAEFCAALRELQQSSGISRTTLARRLSYGRSQLYEILDGRIKRPPEWDRLVEPLVRACLAGRLAGRDQDRAVAEWRSRHEVLLRVHSELARQNGLAAADAAIRGGGASRELLARSARLWPRLVEHPFVKAVASGELADDVFRRWMVNDHYYNLEYQRFIAGLAGIAPTTAATEAIAAAIPGSYLGLDQIRQLAGRYAIDLDVEPGPTAVGFAAYLQAQVPRGYEPALAALVASEKVYFDTWTAIRPFANRSTPYWHLVEYWSSEIPRHWIGGVTRLLDAAAPAGPSAEACRVFDRVVRFELLFWSALHAGETW